MIVLEGLAEGVVGAHKVSLETVDDVFDAYPALIQVKDKLVIKGNRISGFAACDG